MLRWVCFHAGHVMIRRWSVTPLKQQTIGHAKFMSRVLSEDSILVCSVEVCTCSFYLKDGWVRLSVFIKKWNNITIKSTGEYNLCPKVIRSLWRTARWLSSWIVHWNMIRRCLFFAVKLVNSTWRSLGTDCFWRSNKWPLKDPFSCGGFGLLWTRP